VLAAMESATRGEYDALQRFVPSVNAAAIEQEALALTGKEATDQLTQQDKILALQSLTLRDNKSAMGAAKEEMGSATGQARLLGAQWEDMRNTLGEALLPVLVELGRFANETLIPALQKMADWVQENSDIISPMAKIVGGAALAISSLALAV